MNQLLFYLLQVIAASGLLYGYYHFALRNKRFHRYNRFYLLMAVAISALIPFLNIPVYFSENETGSSIVLQTLQVISYPAVEQTNIAAIGTERVAITWFNVERFVYLFYSLVILFFLIRVFISLNKIRFIIKGNKVEQIDKIKFVNTDEPGTPYSFFRWLFWNRRLELHSERGEQIFRHELFHIQQKHSWDIIFIELVSTIFWINPFFHIIKKELKAIHEFLADEFAIKENNHWQYAELLLMQVLNTNDHLVTPFFHNQIKRRIAMITTSKKPSYQYLRKLMVFPVAAIIFLLFAFNYKNRKNDSIANTYFASQKFYSQSYADTSKLWNSALIIINGKIQKKRGMRNIDTTLFSQKQFTGSLLLETLWGQDALEKYGETGRDGVVEIFFEPEKSKITDTIPNVILVKNMKPPTKKSPTAENLREWQNAKMYGVWLDSKRIANNELAKYKPADFDLYYVSKLEKNAVNYGKHYYEVDLYTPAYYKNHLYYKNSSGIMIRDASATDTTKPRRPEPLIVINGKLLTSLQFREIDKIVSPNDIESVHVLKDKTALDKYGEQAKNGVIEIKTKTLVVKEITLEERRLAEDESMVFEKVEIEPAFVGGVTAWKEFYKSNVNVNVPVENKAPDGTYTVVLRFIVDEDGSINDLEALTSLGYGMEEESLRVMKLSPKWKPAIQNGRIVKAYRKQPFNFVVNKK